MLSLLRNYEERKIRQKIWPGPLFSVKHEKFEKVKDMKKIFNQDETSWILKIC